MVSVFIIVCICDSLAPERMDECHSYSVFMCSFVIGPYPINMKIPVATIWALQNDGFLQNSFSDFDYISILYKTFSQINCLGGISRKIAARAIGSKTQIFGCVQTGFTAQMDFIVNWYSATNNGLSGNNWSYLQDNAVKVNCIWEIMRNVFAPIFKLILICWIQTWIQVFHNVIFLCVPLRAETASVL
jgi:hypothetical protein